MVKRKHAAALLGSLTAAMVVCYGLLAPFVATPLYNSLLFYPDYPSRYEEDRYQIKSLQGIAREDLHILTAGGNKLHAWLFRNKSAKYLVVVSHGNASNISYRT